MSIAFPEAPDFNEGSQPWRRTAESTITSLSTDVEILKKNLRAYQRSTAAGSKATNLKISQLQGTRIPPGTPINVTVFPYAYFSTSGYPAAGAKVYWGDQNDADHYEIWVRRVSGNDDPLMADTQQASVTQIATADIRGLECETDYELMIRAISYGGSYGFFTGTVPFTTPNELTQIGPFGGPNVWYNNGFGIVEWRTPEWIEPPYTEYTDTGTPVSAPTIGWANGAKGVLAPNGKIYYPPGGWTSAPSVTSRGLIFNPATLTYTESDYGLPPYLDQDDTGTPRGIPGHIAGGVLGDNGWIYWVSNWESVTGDGESGSPAWATIIALNPATELATYTPVVNGRIYADMAKGGNGHIYARPYSDAHLDFLIISPTGTVTRDDFGITFATGETYGQAVTDANGNVWFMPTNGNPNFLKFTITGSTVSVARVAIEYPGGFGSSGYGGLFGPTLAPNGNVYAFSWKSDQQIWFEIAPDGSQTYGEMAATQGRGMGNAAVGADGRIHGMGIPYDSVGFPLSMKGGFFTDAYGNFDPTTKAWNHTDMGVGPWLAASAVADQNGVIHFRNTNNGSVDNERFISVSSSAVDHPGIPNTEELPPYFKHMLVERSNGDDIWFTLGAMPAEGYFTDPSILPGETYEYRLTPISASGTPGISGPTDTLEVPEP